MTDPVITLEQLAQALDCPPERAAPWHRPLTVAMEGFAISTPRRQAAFLAQIGHETGGLKWVREIWGPTLAQRRYELRRDLGNTEAGDGKRFMGRGLIQLTGRANYAQARDGLRAYMPLAEVPDFEADPEVVAQPLWASLTACWFWHSRALNDLADIGDFEALTRRINGGLNGIEDRVMRLRRADAALGVV